MKTKFLKIFHYLWSHLFGTIIVVAILFLAFFSDYSYWELLKMKDKENEMRKEIRDFRESTNKYQQDIEARTGDSDDIEHFAREKMGMKAPDEDVFIIKD